MTKELLLKAIDLPPSERYRLAFLIAESLGYALTREPDLSAVAKAIREEIVREYRDNDRTKCPAGILFWEEDVQPMLLAEVAIRIFQKGITL